MIDRPKRVWAICFMLVIVPFMSLALNLFLLMADKIPEALELTPYNLSIMFFLPSALIFSSIMFFLGKPNAHRYTLSLSIIYFGMLIYQSINLLQYGSLPQETIGRVNFNIAQNSVELLLVIWVVFSEKTETFMAKMQAVS